MTASNCWRNPLTYHLEILIGKTVLSLSHLKSSPKQKHDLLDGEFKKWNRTCSFLPLFHICYQRRHTMSSHSHDNFPQWALPQQSNFCSTGWEDKISNELKRKENIGTTISVTSSTHNHHLSDTSLYLFIGLNPRKE